MQEAGVRLPVGPQNIKNMVKAVIFDVDGVLLNSFEANLKFYQNLAHKIGVPLPTREQFQKLFHLSMYDVIKILTQSDSEDKIKRI